MSSVVTETLDGPALEEPEPFADNVEFLAAKAEEAMLMLRRAALIGETNAPARSKQSGGEIERLIVRQPGLFNSRQPSPVSDMNLDEVEHRLSALRQETRARLGRSDPEVVPFLGLVRRFNLSEPEQDVLWLLFFKATSLEFRGLFRDLDPPAIGRSNMREMYVGDILNILYPSDFRRQLAGRSLFSTDGSLMGRYLVRAPYEMENHFSVLELEIVLSGRLIHWITADRNQYVAEMPFVVERPKTGLSRVVLPEETVAPVLKLVERYEEYVERRQQLGIDDVVDYGRAVVILEYGPPGTGKTLLARAISHHTGRPLVSQPCDTGPPEIGLGRRRREYESLSTLFREGEIQNGIVFIDECEDLCRKESPHLKELLLELEKSDALVIMTTNQPKLIAPAIDRRITLKVPFDLPDAPMRRRIWELLLPDDVPLAEDVDLDFLARTFPLAGGYIKNAVLTAINFALSRSLDDQVVVTQADLELAARLQERQVSTGLALRELKTARVTLDDCAVSGEERRRLEAIAGMVANYRDVMRRWGLESRVTRARSRGLKVLFQGENYGAAREAAEAVAGNLSMRINEIELGDIIAEEWHQKRNRANPENTRNLFRIRDLFRLSAESDHVMVIRDDHGLLSTQCGLGEEHTLRVFFGELADFDGTAILVTAARRIDLALWGWVFHERLRFGLPDVAARSDYWRRALDTTIPLAEDVRPDLLAAACELGFADIQAAVHKACLLQAAEDPGGELHESTIRRAVHDVLHRTGERSPLFG